MTHIYLLLIVLSGLTASAQQTVGTVYPILDSAYASAIPGHLGQSRTGQVGTVNQDPKTITPAQIDLVCSGSGSQTRCPTRFRFQFPFPNQDNFAGVYFSLGRLTVQSVNDNGTPGPDIDLHNDSTWNLKKLMLNATDIVSIESLRLVLEPRTNQPLTLRVEIQDGKYQTMFRRVVLGAAGSPSPSTLTLPMSGFTGAVDLTAVKLVTIVIEERNVADGVSNPLSGEFLIDQIAFVDEDGPAFDAAAVAVLNDRSMVLVIARRDFEALRRLVDSATGASLDRTLFRDLIQWGGNRMVLVKPSRSRPVRMDNRV